jgi:hypothetical protein
VVLPERASHSNASASNIAIDAHEDGEPDPLAYLRDALPDDPGVGGGRS